MKKEIEEALNRRLRYKYKEGNNDVYYSDWENDNHGDQAYVVGDAYRLADAFLEEHAADQINTILKRKIQKKLQTLEEEKSKIQQECRHQNKIKALDNSNSSTCAICGKKVEN